MRKPLGLVMRDSDSSQKKESGENRGSFTGKLGFVLAAAASAVGLGNLWRFPYLTSHYGGGAFLVVYVALAVTFGFTLLIAEVSLGRRTGKSCIDAFRDLSKKYSFIGWLLAIIPILIVPYYCVIGGWVLKYFVESATGNLETLATGGSGGDPYWWDYITGTATGSVLDPSVWFVIFAALCIIIINLGVSRGIEKVSKILMPMLLVMLLIVTAFTFTLDGIGDGLAFYLVPKFEDLSYDTFLGAVSQIFYSMSLAMGIMITYGSYMKKDVNIEHSARNIGLIDTGVAFIAGLMIVPAAFCFGFQDSSGMGLMFNALPMVFHQMPMGEIVAPVFFLLVVFAALTSAMSLAETAVSIFKDRMHVSRTVAVGIVSAIILGLGLVCCLGFGPWMTNVPGDQGAGWLGIFDTLTNSILMPIAAILTCFFIGFVVKTALIEEEIEINGEFRSKKLFRVMIKYVCPLCLLAILISGMYGTFFA